MTFDAEVFGTYPKRQRLPGLCRFLVRLPARPSTEGAKPGKDAEVRTACDGKPWASFPVADAQDRRRGPAMWVRVALFGDAVGARTPRLLKGTQV